MSLKIWKPLLYTDPSYTGDVGTPTRMCARQGHSASFLANGQWPRIVIFGGQDAGYGYLNDLWFYDITNNTYVKYSPQGTLPDVRGYHAAVIIQGNQLVILGGYTPGTCIYYSTSYKK